MRPRLAVIGARLAVAMTGVGVLMGLGGSSAGEGSPGADAARPLLEYVKSMESVIRSYGAMVESASAVLSEDPSRMEDIGEILHEYASDAEAITRAISDVTPPRGLESAHVSMERAVDLVGEALSVYAAAWSVPVDSRETTALATASLRGAQRLEEAALHQGSWAKAVRKYAERAQISRPEWLDDIVVLEEDG